MATVDLTVKLCRLLRVTPIMTLSDIARSLEREGIAISDEHLEAALAAAGGELVAPGHWRMSSEQLTSERDAARRATQDALAELVNYRAAVQAALTTEPPDDEDEGSPEHWRAVAQSMAKVQRSTDRLDDAIAKARDLIRS